MLLFFCEDINRMMGIDREKELELKEIDVIFPWSVFLFLFFFFFSGLILQRWGM